MFFWAIVVIDGYLDVAVNFGNYYIGCDYILQYLS